jgi:hypothetical protein
MIAPALPISLLPISALPISALPISALMDRRSGRHPETRRPPADRLRIIQFQT